MIYNNIIELIGNTPIIKLNSFNDEAIADIYVKLEKYNIGGSVKDRAALGMIEEAEKQGLLKPNSVIIEPTSGNTGISLAMIGRSKGYNVIIIMPETMSIERRNIIKAFGAELILTEGSKGMKGAIEEAERMASENSNYFLPQQFNNYANPKKHYETTAEEILSDFTNLDAFIAGVGTSGTIVGVGKKLKDHFPNIKVIAVEPEASHVLSGGTPGKHAIQGIGAGFIPKIYDENIIDEVMQISNELSFEFGNKMSKEEGLFLGISSGAAIAAAYEIAKRLGKGKNILVISPDGGEKYLSTDMFK